MNEKDTTLYDKKLFQDLCNEMGLSMDETSDYDAAIARMHVFYPPNVVKE